MSNYLWLVIAAGALGVLYGLVQTAALMKASTGNDKMREIAAAIQEGASAYLRDALVRAGHRTPFVVADDWTRIDIAALSASLMRSAASIAGRGAVTRVEVVSQAPRRRTGLRVG